MRFKSSAFRRSEELHPKSSCFFPLDVSSHQPSTYFQLQHCVPCLPGKTHCQARPCDVRTRPRNVGKRKGPGEEEPCCQLARRLQELPDLPLCKHPQVLTARKCKGKISDDSWGNMWTQKQWDSCTGHVHVMASCLRVILKSCAPLPGIPDFFLELWKLRQIVTTPRTLNAGGEAKG